MRQAHFEREQHVEDVESDGGKKKRRIRQEDDIDFQELEDAFFQMEKQERPTLGVKHNIRICTQTLATVAFSCHTSAILPVAFVGIFGSCAIIFLCLWRKQLNYIWMTEMAAYHLHGTLVLIVCVSTAAMTMLAWAHCWEAETVDEELLEGYIFVLRVIGIFSLALYGCLVVFWVYKRNISYARRKRGQQALLSSSS